MGILLMRIWSVVKRQFLTVEVRGKQTYVSNFINNWVLNVADQNIQNHREREEMGNCTHWQKHYNVVF